MQNFHLPNKLDSYLATLNRLYERRSEGMLRDIVVNGVVTVHEAWEYDNWNGGTYGHAVTLTLPEDIFVQVIDEKDKAQSRIAKDINAINNIPQEFISEVFIEMKPDKRDRWREESGVYRPALAPHSVSADALERIWGPHHVRVFLSHKTTIKEQASRLKHSLAKCGIGAFVAHEDIEPTEEWHREIERSLFSMDALVALLTEDFHDSNWTDQEVGVAIGRGTPLIAVRLGRDPYGLMGKGQGLGGCNLTDTDTIALKIFELLAKRLSDKSRLFESALAAYTASKSWADSGWKAKHLLTKFSTLSRAQVNRVLEAYNGNVENQHSFDGRDVLEPLLKKWTGNEWKIVDHQFVECAPADDDLPF